MKVKCCMVVQFAVPIEVHVECEGDADDARELALATAKEMLEFSPSRLAETTWKIKSEVTYSEGGE